MIRDGAYINVVVICLLAFCLTGCSRKNQAIELPSAEMVAVVQYNSTKITADRIGAEKIAVLVRSLEELQPVEGVLPEVGNPYDTISLIYDDGNKEVFVFWETDGLWYVKAQNGNVYDHADFVQEYIDRTEAEAQLAIDVSGHFQATLPGSYYEYEESYDIVHRLLTYMNMGYSRDEAMNIVKKKVIRDDCIYQYAMEHGCTISDAELEEYIGGYIADLENNPDYAEVEDFYKESGTSLAAEIRKREDAIRKSMCIQLLYGERYDAFRCGEDTINNQVYWTFDEYWNMYVNEIVLAEEYDTSHVEELLERAAILVDYGMY